MVAKTPTKAKRIAAAAAVAALNPNLVRETLKKVDQCMARLQELQYTVAGGAKVVAGVNLSPRSTRGYLRTSLRCKQETLRMRTATSASAKKSPPGKFQCSIYGDWRRMSLPAMLIGETVVEILQATEFAKQVVVATAAAAAATKVAGADPKTPHMKKRSSCNPPKESTPLRSRRVREKQSLLRAARSESSAAGASPPLPCARARVRIRFKPDSPSLGARQSSVAANRVSPRNRPWARKAVLFPNPLFLPNSSTSPSSSSHKQRFYKTRSPIIGTTAAARRKKEFQQTPHKFVIKSPPAATLRSQLASKKAVPAAALRSPPPRARRCSFSPSKLASRLVSPLRTRMVAIRRSSEGLSKSGLKQRPIFSTPGVRVSSSRWGF